MSSLLIILKKELKDIFRDKKTLIFTLLLPIIIFPAMFALMDSGMKDTQKQVEKGVNIGIRDKGDSQVIETFRSNKQFIISNGNDLDEELKKGRISAIVEIPEDFDNKVKEEKSTNIRIIYDETSGTSEMAMNMIRAFLGEYSKQIVNARMQGRGIDVSIINPFDIESVINKKEQEKANPMAAALLNMIPTFIVLFMFVPTVGVAADLGAGEKERGTLEPLLTTSVKRSSILWGKVATIALVAFVTLIISVIAMGASLQFIFDNAAKSIELSTLSILLIAAISLLFLVVISSIEMAISIYSRSMKEANSYLTGVMFVNMILMYVPIMADSKNLKPSYFHIPVTNVVCILKEFTVGIFNINHIITVVLWLLIYIALSVMYARYMFSKEEVIFRA